MPPRRLTQEGFVDAGLALLRGVGVSSLTLKAVGEAVGADTTAVYRHFRSKDALMAAMVDQVVAELVERDLHDALADLEHIARRFREILLEYPTLAATIVGTEVVAPNALRLAERVIADLRQLGLSGLALVETFQSLENFVLGSCMIDIDGAPHHWEIRQARYALISDPDFAEVGRQAASVHATSDAAYAYGIRVLLDAAVNEARRARGG